MTLLLSAGCLSQASGEMEGDLYQGRLSEIRAPTLVLHWPHTWPNYKPTMSATRAR